MPKQILLVEDSITMQKVVEITFGHEDYRITSAKDADEALQRIGEVRPDVVLADAGLPGKSGYDLCASLKADAGTREIPVVLLTGNFSPFDEARGQRAGVDAHVVKPFETQVLIDKVADLLRRRGGASAQAPATTLVAMPIMQVPAAQPVGAVAASERRSPTIPPAAPAAPRVQVQPPSMASRPPAAAEVPVQRSTLMGIPAVNPLGSAGLRPPPPPGMRVRETGNHPAINPGATPAAPAPAPSALPSWGRPATGAPQAAIAQAPTAQAPAQLQPSAPPPSLGERPTVIGIPMTVPQMPRPSLIPRAPVPAPVLAVLERIAQRGAEYEAIAKLSMEAIEQIVWEVVPELAEAMIRAEMDRLVKERQS